MNTTVCIVAIISAIACAHAFSNHANINAIRQVQGCRSRHHHHNFLLSKQFHISNAVRKAAESDESEDDDGGWGTTPSVDRISKSQELARLQDEMTMKKTQNNKSSQISSSNSREEERDLFIPIFALVSVLGFTGLYGYEMLRLYSRGELYLPWNN